MADHCSSCHAEIRWIELGPTWKRHPIDPKPVPEGTIQLLANERPSYAEQCGLIPPKATRKKLAAKGVKFYRSHFASCPNAAQHRRSR